MPLDWISADIAVIHKKGSRKEIGNYRPVSLTSICCKMMESFIRDHLMEYFLSHQLFSNKQFGFIKCKSTVTQLLTVLDKWTECLEMNGQVDVIYTDFEKAFDKVPHKRLTDKLSSYGIDVEIIKWIKAFLANRRQRVKINGHFLVWREVFSGIPQGSILGPILSIIFINDLVEVCGSSSDLFLYADDAKLFKHVRNTVDTNVLQKDLDNFKQWSDHWLLKLILKKC